MKIKQPAHTRDNISQTNWPPFFLLWPIWRKLKKGWKELRECVWIVCDLFAVNYLEVDMYTLKKNTRSLCTNISLKCTTFALFFTVNWNTNLLVWRNHWKTTIVRYWMATLIYNYMHIFSTRSLSTYFASKYSSLWIYLYSLMHLFWALVKIFCKLFCRMAHQLLADRHISTNKKKEKKREEDARVKWSSVDFCMHRFFFFEKCMNNFFPFHGGGSSVFYFYVDDQPLIKNCHSRRCFRSLASCIFVYIYAPSVQLRDATLMHKVALMRAKEKERESRDRFWSVEIFSYTIMTFVYTNMYFYLRTRVAIVIDACFTCHSDNCKQFLSAVQ